MVHFLFFYSISGDLLRIEGKILHSILDEVVFKLLSTPSPVIRGTATKVIHIFFLFLRFLKRTFLLMVYGKQNTCVVKKSLKHADKNSVTTGNNSGEKLYNPAIFISQQMAYDTLSMRLQ